MYTLLSGLYKYMFRKDEYCVLILGLDNAGKTYYAEYHGVIYVIDSTDEEHLSESKEAFGLSHCCGLQSCFVSPLLRTACRCPTLKQPSVTRPRRSAGEIV